MNAQRNTLYKHNKRTANDKKKEKEETLKRKETNSTIFLFHSGKVVQVSHIQCFIVFRRQNRKFCQNIIFHKFKLVKINR